MFPLNPFIAHSIPEANRQILLDIGSWLAVNGESIYGTRPWKIFGEGPTEVIELLRTGADCC